ncbi:MAG: hypothetical protein AABZ60_00890, partial [Planctomycetota bacterium]
MSKFLSLLSLAGFILGYSSSLVEAQSSVSEKEVKNFFSKDSERYKLFNEILLYHHHNDSNQVLLRILKLYPLFNTETTDELERILVQETGERWLSLIQKLRDKCEICNESRQVKCSECKGQGYIERGSFRKIVDCTRCKKTGSFPCKACAWRQDDAAVNKAVDFFDPKSKIKFDVRSICEVKVKVLWGGVLCKESSSEEDTKQKGFHIHVTTPGAIGSFLTSTNPGSFGWYSSDQDKKWNETRDILTFSVAQGAYALVYWQKDYYYFKRIFVNKAIEVTLPLVTTLEFLNPNSEGQVLTKPITFQWKNAHEDLFAAKIF